MNAHGEIETIVLHDVVNMTSATNTQTAETTGTRTGDETIDIPTALEILVTEIVSQLTKGIRDALDHDHPTSAMVVIDLDVTRENDH